LNSHGIPAFTFIAVIATTATVAQAQATFNTSNQILTVPTIDVDGRTYRNLQARLDPDGRLTIVSLTEPTAPSADFQNCTPPSALNAGSFTPRAVFQTPLQMFGALAGTWQGCDIFGSTVSFTVANNSAIGTISRHTNYFATYTFCTYRLENSYAFVTSGQWDMRPVSLTCAEGNGLNQAQGDVFTVYIKGPPGLATEVMLELNFKPFAMLIKR
jgi:hypothetical protein